ncbi:MAG: cyclase family protein [Chloroflexi bacterium]|nr:cyclase family protein [Chloroflexota bacterium]
MSQRIIDLSLPIVSGEYWTKYPGGMVYGQEEPPTLIECFSTIEKTTVCMHKYNSTTQSFTHIDAPRHVYDDGIANDQVPLERLIGDGAVIDVTHKQPNEIVSAADLEKGGGQVREGDIAIIRSGWTERGPWGTERFWREMIYLAEDAGQWLDKKNVKAIAVDFLPDLPQFYTDANDGRLRPTNLGHPTHLRLMKKGLVFVEWCTNLTAIQQPRVKFFCLPLRLVGTDGAQARVIAIEEE